MLVDLIKPIDIDEHTRLLVEAFDGMGDLEKLDHGLYRGGFNANVLLQNIVIEEYPFCPITPPEGYNRDTWLKEVIRRIGDKTYPNDYGVVDYPHQIVEQFPRILNDPRPFVITFCQVYRADEPPQGGWRWHKWGPYYGKHKIQYEHLYDEEGIEFVWTFHIEQVKEGSYE